MVQVCIVVNNSMQIYSVGFSFSNALFINYFGFHIFIKKHLCDPDEFVAFV